MARIRSVHPGFFTDEELVCVSMAARLLFIGLGVEADDKGIFEWKPLSIKMKIFPADSLDIDTLLAELEHANAIRKYEIDGRQYGAIRNFRKFQRPKTPNDIHPAPPDIRNYVGLDVPTSETLPQSGGKPSEIRPQMEDGGDKMEDEGRKKEEKNRARRGNGAGYVFSGNVIRLLPADYELWKASFHAIPDFDAELISIDAWLKGQPEEKKHKWFQSASGSLNRKHQEILAARDAVKLEEEEPFQI